MKQNRLWLAGLAQIEGISCQEYKNIVRGELKFNKVSEERLVANGESFLSKVGGNVVFLGEEGYPQFLQEIYDPPKYIFYEGNLSQVDFNLAVSIVGTLTPSSYGRSVASFLASKLAKIGLPIVSGLAMGIDRLAQSVSMQVGGLSIGVLGEAIDVWKSNHSDFYNKYKERLILVSEYLPGTPAQKFTFPQRNRIIAGLTCKSVIVEAASRSGALITADFANQYERAVFAVPHDIYSLKGRGCNELIKSNRAEILTNPIDLFGSFFWKQANTQTRLVLTPELQKIIDIIKESNLSVEEIAAKLDAPVGALLPSLTKLETIGILTKLIDGRYKISLNMN